MTIGTVSRYETAAGARVCVGAAQLAPHRRIDLAGWGADYVALSGHKIYAPYGAGVLVGRRDRLDAAPRRPGGPARLRPVVQDPRVQRPHSPKISHVCESSV